MLPFDKMMIHHLPGSKTFESSKIDGLDPFPQIVVFETSCRVRVPEFEVGRTSGRLGGTYGRAFLALDDFAR